jgi:hypothetical protein
MKKNENHREISRGLMVCNNGDGEERGVFKGKSWLMEGFGHEGSNKIRESA